MPSERIYVASIAGHDPSGGAGLLADIKTFEMNKVYGFGICSAMTWQNDDQVEKVQWYSADDIIVQLELLIRKFSVDWYKIGIIDSWKSLKKVVDYIKSVNPRAKIIWDPVLKASSDYVFFEDKPDRVEIAQYVDMITPNINEFKVLFVDDLKALEASEHMKILKKGGHDPENPGRDTLFHKGKRYHFNPKGKNNYPKHGSGCVLSAALCANFAKGYPFLKACLRSKRYMEQFLSSDKGLLGWHKR